MGCALRLITLCGLMLCIAWVVLACTGCRRNYWPPGVTDAAMLGTVPKNTKGIRVLDSADSVLPELHKYSELEYVYVVARPDRQARDWAATLLHLASLPRLKQIVLVGLDGVGDNVITSLAACKSLEHLSFDDCAMEFGESGVALLAELPKLRYLSLGSAPNVNDAAMRPIDKMTSLTHLLIGGTRVTDATVERIIRLPYLEEITLPESVSAEARARITNAAPKCVIRK